MPPFLQSRACVNSSHYLYLLPRPLIYALIPLPILIPLPMPPPRGGKSIGMHGVHGGILPQTLQLPLHVYVFVKLVVPLGFLINYVVPTLCAPINHFNLPLIMHTAPPPSSPYRCLVSYPDPLHGGGWITSLLRAYFHVAVV